MRTRDRARERERERERDREGFIRVMRNSVQTHGRADSLVDLRFVSIAHVRLAPSAAFSLFAIFSGKPFILVVGSDAEHRQAFRVCVVDATGE